MKDKDAINVEQTPITYAILVTIVIAGWIGVIMWLPFIIFFGLFIAVPLGGILLIFKGLEYNDKKSEE